MASDATISMFDQKNWDTVLIPAAYDLFSRKTIRPWVKSAFSNLLYLKPSDLWEIKNFENNCSAMLDFGALDASLHSSIKTQTQPRNYWGSKTSREHHRCHDHTCSSNDHCPFYGIGNAVSEDYGYYFYVLVESILCENYRNIFLRKRYSVHAYENLLAENDIAEDDQLRALLDRLGQRGIYIGNGVSEWSGVHGWLNSEECTQLAEELWCIDLPYFESTPEHLQSKRPNQKMLMDVSGETEREKMWHQMTLAYLRAFAEIAGNTGKGIVWMST